MKNKDNIKNLIKLYYKYGKDKELLQKICKSKEDKVCKLLMLLNVFWYLTLIGCLLFLPNEVLIIGLLMIGFILVIKFLISVVNLSKYSFELYKLKDQILKDLK